MSSSPYYQDTTFQQPAQDNESAALERVNSFKQGQLRAALFNSVDATLNAEEGFSSFGIVGGQQQDRSPSNLTQKFSADGPSFVDQEYNNTIDRQQRDTTFMREVKLIEFKKQKDQAFENLKWQKH